MKVRAIQFGPGLGKIEDNLDFHRKAISRAVRDRFDLVVFPELSLTGYHLKDIVTDVAQSPQSPILRELAELSREIDIVAGAPYEEIPGIFYNSALYFASGKLHHIHRKTQLPNFGIFEEAMIFKPGSHFHSFPVRGFTVGLLICREVLFPINAYLYYLQNCDFLIAISNSPFRGLSQKNFSSFALWETLGYVYSVFYHQNFLFVNRSGFEEGIGFGGGSFFASPGTGIIQRAPYFRSSVLDQKIDSDTVRRARFTGNYLRDEKPGMIQAELSRILNERDRL
jgi:predicted amidohydrolase